jgi:hypothetical protein
MDDAIKPYLQRTGDSEEKDEEKNIFSEVRQQAPVRRMGEDIYPALTR